MAELSSAMIDSVGGDPTARSIINSGPIPLVTNSPPSSAHILASGNAVDYGSGVVSGDSANGYNSLYGATLYRSALANRYQAGTITSRVATPDPILVLQKYGNFAGPSSGTPIWNQGLYVGLNTTGQGTFPVAVTGHAEVSGAGFTRGQAIGVHGRVTMKDGFAGSGYGGWFYCNADSPNLQAAHAIEVNGSTTNDPGYAGSYQLVRLSLADNPSATNRFSNALTIARQPAATFAETVNNGFYTGIRIGGDSIVRGAPADDGEAIRIDGPSGYNATAGQHYGGGVRFSVNSYLSASLSSTFKYAVRTDEVSFYNDTPYVLGDGQRFRFGGINGTMSLVGSSGASATTGFLRVDNGYLNANPDATIGIALQYRGTKVVGPRVTGWTLPTGTGSRATFDPATVTLSQLAQAVAQLIKDLYNSHGLIGA